MASRWWRWLRGCSWRPAARRPGPGSPGLAGPPGPPAAADAHAQVSVLGCPDPVVHEIAYQYGKNVGIAFQLIDDVLDFTSCSDQMGKPTSADLKLGLATGPVLFACQQFPEMNAMIMRRFSLPGDVDRARQYVLQSDGVQQTTYLAQQYCHEAIREISKLRPSPERDALIQLSEIVLTRDK
ncbi:hypothetical protein H8959_011537 [Pygathrix nigripes]